MALQIVHAADHPQRREYYVGSNAVATIFGDKLVPGLLDRFLARSGYESQQTAEPASPDRPANLFVPADGPGGHDYGAHGSFDRQAKNRSVQAQFNRAPYAVSAVGNVAAALVAGTRMVWSGRKAFIAALRDLA